MLSIDPGVSLSVCRFVSIWIYCCSALNCFQTDNLCNSLAQKFRVSRFSFSREKWFAMLVSRTPFLRVGSEPKRRCADEYNLQTHASRKPTNSHLTSLSPFSRNTRKQAKVTCPGSVGHCAVLSLFLLFCRATCLNQVRAYVHIVLQSLLQVK